MRNTILYIISVFTLLLVAAFMLVIFIVSVYPFKDVTIQKITPLKNSYARGEVLDKTLVICKKTATPIKIVLEMTNGDIIPLATKESFADAGCKEYIISQAIPMTTKLEEHNLIVTVSYPVWFRTISQQFESDRFIVTTGVLK